jgi:hypothetical protein
MAHKVAESFSLTNRALLWLFLKFKRLMGMLLSDQSNLYLKKKSVEHFELLKRYKIQSYARYPLKCNTAKIFWFGFQSFIDCIGKPSLHILLASFWVCLRIKLLNILVIKSQYMYILTKIFSLKRPKANIWGRIQIYLGTHKRTSVCQLKHLFSTCMCVP